MLLVCRPLPIHYSFRLENAVNRIALWRYYINYDVNTETSNISLRLENAVMRSSLVAVL